jgi:hypothetical protein
MPFIGPFATPVRDLAMVILPLIMTAAFLSMEQDISHSQA